MRRAMLILILAGARVAGATERTPPPQVSEARPLVIPVHGGGPRPAGSASRQPAPRQTAVQAFPQRMVTITDHGPLAASDDHRFARPDPFAVSHSAHPAPSYAGYRPYWTAWWVHPYWRWTHAVSGVQQFRVAPRPWIESWVPPSRPGWSWVAGRWSGDRWIPGDWAPIAPPARWFGQRWTYVPGGWIGTSYVDGFWRLADRPGWSWVDAEYLADGTWVPGSWEPDGGPPEPGYVWEPGYWDGTYWVEGFWRPERRAGNRWVSAWYDEDGVRHAGYWEPVQGRPGMIWIPGWFDGTEWIDGFWVTQEEYRGTDPQRWVPEPGWDQSEPPEDLPRTEEPPSALPVQAAVAGE